jgi:hypothetical protein
VTGGAGELQSPGLPAFETDLFVPRYRPSSSGPWELSVTDFCIAPGYWSGPMLVRNMAVLFRGHDSWMSVTPLEVESQQIGIRLARGHVLIFGLGMGWAAAAAAAMPAVRAVTVVEQDQDVLALHRELEIFGQLPDSTRAKLRVVEGDAYRFRPEQPVDLLMPDIWLPLVSDNRLDEVRRMQANVSAGGIYFWGQELEIARHAVAAGCAMDDAGIAATVAETGLPLIGLNFPDYAGKLQAAARRWMRGRWLAGSEPPWSG